MNEPVVIQGLRAWLDVTPAWWMKEPEGHVNKIAAPIRLTRFIGRLRNDGSKLGAAMDPVAASTADGLGKTVTVEFLLEYADPGFNLDALRLAIVDRLSGPDVERYVMTGNP